MIRITAILFAFALGPAAAQTPAAALLGEFRDWTAATMQADGKICLAYTQPRESAPKNLKRDPIILYVTRRPGRSGKIEVSIKIGYAVRDKSTPTASIGDETFDMFARNDTAWLANIEDDVRLIEAMRKSQDLVIQATSRRGTRTTDTFSLAGMSAAVDRALRECR